MKKVFTKNIVILACILGGCTLEEDTELTLNSTSLVLEVGETSHLDAIYRYSSKSNEDRRQVVWSSSNNDIVKVLKGDVLGVNPGTATITAIGTGLSSSCQVKVIGGKTISGHSYVEMEDGIKWALMNVGATKSEEFGDLFAWGETTNKNYFTWNNYFDNPSGDEFTFVKYTTNKKKSLDLDDDVARQSWGGSWRLPTEDEWEKLITKCTWTWTDNYYGTRVAGWIVSRDKPGSGSRHIFFPAKQLAALSDSYSGGFYWSSSLYTTDPRRAYALDLYRRDATGNDTRSILSYERYKGLYVRPVSE